MVVLLILRPELGGLVGGITRIRREDTAIEFEQGMRDARDALRRLPVDAAGAHVESPPADAGLAPREAVLAAWRRVEEALARFTGRHGVSATPRGEPGARDDIMQVLDFDLLSRATLLLLDRLRRIRNSALHLGEDAIDAARAREYEQMARRAERAIDAAQAWAQPASASRTMPTAMVTAVCEGSITGTPSAASSGRRKRACRRSP